MRAKRKVLAALLVVGAVAAFAYVRLSRIHGVIAALEPVDGRHAVFCMRADGEYGLPARAWIGLRAADGTWQWSTRLHGLPAAGARDGLLVDDGIVVVRTADGNGGWTSAYALDSGKELWRAKFDRDSAGVVDLVANGRLVLQGASFDGKDAVAAVQRATGTVDWSIPFDPATDESLTVDRGAIVITSSRAADAVSPPTVLEGPTDIPQPEFFHTRGQPCVEKDEILYFERTERGGRISAVSRPSGERRRVVVDKLSPSEWNERSVACGHYGDRLIFTLALTKASDVAAADVALLEVDPAAGKETAYTRLAIGTSELACGEQRATDRQFSTSATMSGKLPRFVPIVVPGKEHDETFALLDLEGRRITKRAAPSGSSRQAVIRDIRKVEEGFLVQSGDAIARIDGKTGELTAAVRALPTTPERVKPFHVRDGALWIYSSRAPDSYSVLDAVTLRPITGNGNLRIEDVTAVTKKALFGE